MQTLRRIIRYWSTLGAVLALVEEAMLATKDGKITNLERTRLFNAFWACVDAAQARKRKP